MGPFWKWKAHYIPVSGRKKKQIFVKRMISPVRHLLVPPPSPLLVENLRFFAELRNVNRKDNLVNYCKKRKKSLVLSCQNRWHMKDWTLFNERGGLKKKFKKRKWKNETMSTLVGSLLYSCRNLTLLQTCNVVLNYAETFYKSNVNCTFFIQK